MSKRIDITNQRFGKLLVIRPCPEMGSPLKWECECDCGNHIFTTGQKLRFGVTKSCGCYKSECTRKRNIKDLTGQRFGKLVVLEKSHIENHRVYWLCQCDCGNTTIVSSLDLTNGNTKSCKCKRNTLNGESRSNLYHRWMQMHMRCRENDPSHKHYYDRGIHVCNEWNGHDGFLNFKKWALSNGYKKELTIDRIDNDKGYSPDNCRWVSMYTQNNNRTDNHYVVIDGEKKTLSQWSEEFGLSYSAVKGRVHQGYDDYTALGLNDRFDS